MHSVMNSFYAKKALGTKYKNKTIIEIANDLSKSSNKVLRAKVKAYASKNGMFNLYDDSGTNISVQIIDLSKVDPKTLALIAENKKSINKDDIIIVMDYAFGKQAYETMDELQVASKIRKSIASDVTLRYAYYASDNPLKTGSTLASGSLGLDGVKPTYAITLAIIKGILNKRSADSTKRIIIR